MGGSRAESAHEGGSSENAFLHEVVVAKRLRSMRIRAELELALGVFGVLLRVRALDLRGILRDRVEETARLLVQAGAIALAQRVVLALFRRELGLVGVRRLQELCHGSLGVLGRALSFAVVALARLEAPSLLVDDAREVAVALRRADEAVQVRVMKDFVCSS